MLEIFTKYKKLIVRSLGALMLVVGLVAHFWSTPKEGFAKDELAAANVARMEAHVAERNPSTSKAAKTSTSPLLEEFINTQAQQMKYLTIITMILGFGFLGYSFIKRD